MKYKLMKKNKQIRAQNSFTEFLLYTTPNGKVKVEIFLRNENIWLTFEIPCKLGTDLEGEYREPKPVYFCDFASAGNTWDSSTRYCIWIRETLNVMKAESIRDVLTGDHHFEQEGFTTLMPKKNS